MSNVSITAIFGDENAARLASETLSLSCGSGMELSVSTKSASAGAARSNGLQSLLMDNRQFLNEIPTSARGAARSHSHILHANCPEHLEAYVVGELAALGAEKISVDNGE